MGYLKKIALTGMVLGGALFYMTTIVKGELAGSKHDFSDSSWNHGDRCAPCHNQRETTYQSFSMYDSSTLDGRISLVPEPKSLACLSCHDGSVALDSFGGQIGTTYINKKSIIGFNGDLTKNHPISVIYDEVKDRGLHPKSSLDMPLFNNKVECSTCHDVHNVSEIDKLLVKSPSTICQTCHDK